MQKNTHHQALTYLLIATLVLSAGLNYYLLSWRTTQPATPALTEELDATETAAELQLTQRLLARCQAEQHRKDSLLGYVPPATAEPLAQFND
ncbi:hypothetical protein H8B13_02885 [Hymenobacter sp. BT188]|uniref:hypothetical protein n=1 Tax=Hymenobacter sp. BT188 TaxID=2763504 RepID=UPI0016512992|nr:hypothetical protein [Hymenobacter sp. BT188]MBC6605754.1 hypothetical protein [Hymenobacter sp. BT188]